MAKESARSGDNLRVSSQKNSVKKIVATGKIEKLFRSPWFWILLIFFACECSSLIQSNRFVFRPEDFWLMISYSFIFVVSLPEFFGLQATRSGTIHSIVIIVGCIFYVLFSFSVQKIPTRLIYHVSLAMLLVVVLMSAGCTAWVMSWHR